jgi:hypothetical protein
VGVSRHCSPGLNIRHGCARTTDVAGWYLADVAGWYPADYAWISLALAKLRVETTDGYRPPVTEILAFVARDRA